MVRHQDIPIACLERPHAHLAAQCNGSSAHFQRFHFVVIAIVFLCLKVYHIISLNQCYDRLNPYIKFTSYLDPEILDSSSHLKIINI